MNVTGLLVRKLLVYLAAVLTAYVLATAFASLNVASRLASMGVETGFGGRLSMIAHDLAGMAGMFLPLIALALLVAFLVTALLHYLVRRGQVALYLLAGAAALATLHLALHAAFGLTPVAAARGAGGLLLQALAGAAGGGGDIMLQRRMGLRVVEPDDA